MKKIVSFVMTLLLLVSCAGGPAAKAGDTVEVHYKGTLEDGTVFDESYGRGQPISFTVWGGQMIAGFDAAVVGMKVGDKKTVTLTPDMAYGEYSPEAVVAVPKEQIGETEGLEVGGELYDPNGRPVKIVEITDTEIKVDVNHPLAGKTLIFEIEMMKIN